MRIYLSTEYLLQSLLLRRPSEKPHGKSMEPYISAQQRFDEGRQLPEDWRLCTFDNLDLGWDGERAEVYLSLLHFRSFLPKPYAELNKLQATDHMKIQIIDSWTGKQKAGTYSCKGLRQYEFFKAWISRKKEEVHCEVFTNVSPCAAQEIYENLRSRSASIGFDFTPCDE